MSDTKFGNKPPNRTWLKVKTRISIPLIMLSMLPLMFTGEALGFDMANSTKQPWQHDPLLLVIIPGIVMAVLGLRFVQMAPPRLTYWYEEVADGFVIHVAENRVEATVRGNNRAGITIEQIINPGAARWKTLDVGTLYPWTD